MTKKKTPELTSPLKLVVRRAEAEQKIQAQIEKGQEILALLCNPETFEAAQYTAEVWSNRVTELLSLICADKTLSDEFASLSSGDRSNYFMELGIAKLESFLDRIQLGLIPDVGMATAPRSLLPASSLRIDIFVVHGHDEGARESVARFIEKLGLRAVILQEQPKGGRTIIEQLEEYSDVGFAIVLMTPDDIGVSVGETEEAKLRARQNVIFEFGYFLGKLERSKVRILRKGNVEIPSDLQGVLYIPMDSAGAWRMALAKEIKNAGIEVDLNKL